MALRTLLRLRADRFRWTRAGAPVLLTAAIGLTACGGSSRATVQPPEKLIVQSPALTAPPATETPVHVAPTKEASTPTTTATTPAASPTSPAATTQAPATTAVYYQNCDAVRAAGAAPIHSGDPGYRPALDRDGDGIGCE